MQFLPLCDVKTVLEAQKDGQGEAADEMDATGGQDDIGGRKDPGDRCGL
jgi:hypothetical protein